MSRTKKGSKAPGSEPWGKRPLKGERAKLKEELAQEPREPEYDPREHVPDEPADPRENPTWGSGPAILQRLRKIKRDRQD